MNKKLVLGLDIGVASVGWGIIDKNTGLIVDKGVRLFSEADPENNVKRRNFRHIRRGLRRKEFRLYRTKRVLLEAGIIPSMDFMPLNNPYQIRCKGVYAILTKDELATAILHLMKRNGFRYEIADEETTGIKSIKEEYLCQHQLNLLIETGKVRGIENKYHFSLYKKEFVHLLESQNIKEEIKNKLLEIFEKRRHFEEGPGGENSPTKYGRYLSLGAEPINLIEKMRGHCSIYKDELRAPKICPSSEIFNLLNDLNNLKVNGNFIGTERKTEIFENYILDKGKITIKQLENYLGCSTKFMSGFRVNKKEEPILTEIKSIQKIRDVCKKNSLPEFIINDFNDIYLLDDVFDVLTQTKNIDERKARLSKLGYPKLSIEYINAFANISGVSEYHSLSFKAVREMTQEMFETNKNSQQIITTLNNEDNSEVQLKIPSDTIMSPVVYKSVNQTFKILKAVIKKYGHLDTVVIEMTRAKNSAELRDKINKSQQRNEEKRIKINEILKGKCENITREIVDKVLLYIEQDGKSVYSLKPIDLNDLITNPQNYEIDHIIPYSISLDDSKNNKVLVYAKENQIKGQRTPYQTLTVHDDRLTTLNDFEAYVVNNNKFSRYKKENLLTKEDIYSGKVREEFINRNLSDTRYATKLVLNTLKQYFKYHEIDTKVHVVNGALTSKLREVCKIKKDRNFYCHHAVDALLIASMLKSQYLLNVIEQRLIDEDTGEIYTLEENEDIFGEVAKIVAAQIKCLDPIKDFKFSYKIDTKPNRSLSDQTLYGTKYINDELHVIKKYKNIYDKDGEKIAKLIKENSKDLDNLLVVKNDPKTFVLLQKIVASYPQEKNPFACYLKEHGYIRKYSKNGLGPVITSLKYIEDKVNVHLDLSHKYSKKPINSKSVKLQLSTYRMDLYYSSEKGYKFVAIRYADINFNKDGYFINETYYKLLKAKQGIDDTFEFVNTFYRGDLMERISGDDVLFEVFKVVNNAEKFKIEMDYFGTETMKLDKDGELSKFQYMTTIGKKISSIKKYSTDILGNRYLVEGERLKLKWK